MTRESLTKAGTVGLRLLEDLTALAAGGSVCAGLKLEVPLNYSYHNGTLVQLSLVEDEDVFDVI